MKKNPGVYTRRVWLILAALSLCCAGTWSSATDYAMQMDKAATSLLLDIATAGDRLVAVGERGHILYSNDQGQSWTQAQVPTSVMLTRVFFVSARLGWAVGHDGNVLLSRDGGVSWALQRDGVSAQADINEQRFGRAKQTVAALRQQLAATPEESQQDLEIQLEDAEYALDSARETLDEPVYAPPLMDVWFANEEQGLASGAYGTLLHTHNGGEHWDDWSHKVGNAEELHLNGVVGDGDGSLYLASEWGIVFRSQSDGATWKAVETGYDGSFFGVLASPASNSIFAYGLLGNVYRSSDSGDSWEQLPSKARASLFGAHVTEDGTLLFVGQGGTVIHSRDDGDSFTLHSQSSRRGLHGVALMPDGRYVVTGEGGSEVARTDSTPAASGGGQEE